MLPSQISSKLLVLTGLLLLPSLALGDDTTKDLIVKPVEAGVFDPRWETGELLAKASEADALNERGWWTPTSSPCSTTVWWTPTYSTWTPTPTPCCECGECEGESTVPQWTPTPAPAECHECEGESTVPAWTPTPTPCCECGECEGESSVAQWTPSPTPCCECGECGWQQTSTWTTTTPPPAPSQDCCNECGECPKPSVDILAQSYCSTLHVQGGSLPRTAQGGCGTVLLVNDNGGVTWRQASGVGIAVSVGLMIGHFFMLGALGC